MTNLTVTVTHVACEVQWTTATAIQETIIQYQAGILILLTIEIGFCYYGRLTDW